MGGQRPTAPKPRPSVEDDALCKDQKIDAVFNTADRETFVFVGAKYYKLTENAISEGYPKLISEGWPGLPGNLPILRLLDSIKSTTFYYRAY